MCRTHRLAIGNCGVKLSSINDCVSIIDTVGHADSQRDYLLNELIYLPRRLASIKKYQKWRIIGCSYSPNKGLGRNWVATMVIVLLAFEHDKVLVAVP